MNRFLMVLIFALCAFSACADTDTLGGLLSGFFRQIDSNFRLHDSQIAALEKRLASAESKITELEAKQIKPGTLVPAVGFYLDSLPGLKSNPWAPLGEK